MPNFDKIFYVICQIILSLFTNEIDRNSNNTKTIENKLKR